MICAVVGVTPFLRDRAADERVDEGALAGVEFADDDQQEQLVELLDRAIERLLMLRRRVEARECRAQPREHAALLAHQLILCAGQNPGQHPESEVHYLSQSSAQAVAAAAGFWPAVTPVRIVVRGSPGLRLGRRAAASVRFRDSAIRG